MRAELDKLLACDLLVLSFPVFWFSVPAILKGWIDRVLVSGAVYGGRRFYDRGGLRGKRAFVAATLGGQPHMFRPDAVHGPIEDMLRHLLRGTLAYTGMQVLPPFLGYHVPYIGDDGRREVMEQFRRRVNGLAAETQGLAAPSLDAFDEHLRPIH